MKTMKKRLTGLVLCLAFLAALATGCTQNTPPSGTPSSTASSQLAAGAYTPGVYTAQADGNNGPIEVSVTFSADSIVSVVVDKHEETPGISEPAIERIPSSIVDNQTLAVDAVTGATNTSNAILSAVEACVLQAGGDVAALKVAQTPASDAPKETIAVETDLLIIGGGAAGLTAANAALENGVEHVLLIDKMASLGGASAVAGGLAGGNSEIQRSFGLNDDSPDVIYNDLMKGGLQQNDARITRIFADNMGAMMDWLINDMQVPIKQQFSNFPEHTVQRTYMVEGGSVGMISTLADRFTADGGETMLETAAYELITDDAGAVIGARATDASGNIVEISAKSTVLATGGFGNNPEMLSDEVSIALFYGAASSTGEGIQMAESVGAKTQFMDYAKMYPQGINVEGNRAKVASVHSAATTQKSGAIYVNKEGQRVVDENLDFVSIKNATKSQTDHIIYLVMDQAAWDIWSKSANDSPSSSGRFTYEEQEKWFESPDGSTPIFRKGEDLEATANAAGIDGAVLKNTISQWNNSVANGKDSEFGRDELIPLSTDGTYYIVEQRLRFATTLGGVRITPQFEVENQNGQPITGLYAAGECVGGAHGVESMPGCMLSWAAVSGKMAGESVARVLAK